MKHVALALFTLFIVSFDLGFGQRPGDTLFAIQAECGTFCYYYKRLNLVYLDPSTAQPTFISNLVGWNYASVIDSMITCSAYDPEMETYYIAISNTYDGSGTLFAYGVEKKAFQTVPIPGIYNGYNISNLEYDQKERHLVANYGPELVRILAGNGKVEGFTKVYNGRYMTSGNRSALDSKSRKYYMDIYEEQSHCMFIYAVDLKNGTVSNSRCYDQSPWTEDPFLRLLFPYYNEDEVLAVWGGNYGRVESIDSVTGASKKLYTDQEFADNKWSTLFYNYKGTDLDTFNPITNQLFMVLREVRPVWNEEVVIGRIDLNARGSKSSTYIDTTYYSYSNLQIYYKV